MNYLPTNIKYLRTRQRISMHQFAFTLQVDKGVPSNWENGVTEPNTIQLKAISDYFEVSINWLVRMNLMDEPNDILKANYQLTKQILETYEK